MKKPVNIELKKEPVYLDIGNNRSVKCVGIVGIFDLDTSTVSKVTRDFLRACERSGDVITASKTLPKSAILYDDGERRSLYFSSFTASALGGRLSGS